MNFDLTPEQEQVRRVVRDFASAELAPHAAETDETAALRPDALRRAAALGLLGLQVPEADGGAGLDTISASLAVEEIGRACGSHGLSIAAHNGLSAAPLARWGTPDQKARWLALLLEGERLGALALTEPNAGSDLLGGVQTSAVRAEGGWRITGSKAWITNASLAPVIIVLARTDADAGSRGFTLLLVPNPSDGLTVHPPEKKMGLRGSPTHALSFDGVFVPDDAVLGEVGAGFRMTMQILDSGRISIGALSVGLGTAALDAAARYATERRAFGKPIADHQAIQFMLADSATELEAARTLVYKAAWLRDAGRDFSATAAMAKLFASEAAERACRSALQVHGSYGYSREYPLERLYRDERLMTIGEGTSEILRVVIARKVLAALR